MKTGKFVFTLFFLTAYLLYASNVILADSSGRLFGSILRAFPSRDGIAYAANEAGSQALPFRAALREGHAYLQTRLKKTESGGMGVVAANDNTYISGQKQSWPDYEIARFAVQMNRLNRELGEAGLDTGVVFISPQPQAVQGYTTPLEAFDLPDQASQMEAIQYQLRGYGVDFLDTPLILRQSGLADSEYIYKTDAIWTTQASFAAAGALVDKLNSQYNAGIDSTALEPERFETVTHENLFLGSMGTQAGEQFTGREDFTTIIPTYDTHFTYEATGWTNDIVGGSFTETLFNDKYLTAENTDGASAYTAYMDGGAYYQRVITNHDRPDAPKVLFIHDVSALPFAAFTALGFSETHMYWPALAPDDSSFQLTEYIAAHDIDYVFFLGECDYYALQSIASVIG